MALTGQSLFRYGFEVTTSNNALDFKKVSGGTEVQATLRSGYYSLTGLMDEVARAMNAADPAHVYGYTINRNVNGGLECRVTITTNGTFLSLLFVVHVIT